MKVLTSAAGRGNGFHRHAGHLDTGEAYDICAVREVREEIGLHLAETPARLFKIGGAVKENGLGILLDLGSVRERRAVCAAPGTRSTGRMVYAGGGNQMGGGKNRRILRAHSF